MAAYSYDNLSGDNVRFLQGTQADLNKYFPNSGDSLSGKAIEGAFYLTTDTHRLYVGRKVSEGTNINKIYPEEVSSSITTVVDSGDLTNVQVSGARDGDFYYIKQGNILAVYENPEIDGAGQSSAGRWVQVNAPAPLARLSQAVSEVVSGDNIAATSFPASGVSKVKIRTSAGTQGNTGATGDAPDPASNIILEAGPNITLKPGEDNKTIQISSANSQSNLSVVNDTSATNNARIKLSDGVNADTYVYLAGAQDTTVGASTSYQATMDSTVAAGKSYYTTTDGYQFTQVTPSSGDNPRLLGYYESVTDKNVINIVGPGIQGPKVTNNSTYVATNDTSVQAGKSYFTRSGSVGSYTYTLVENPPNNTNPKTSSYYEQVTGFKVAVSVKNGATSEVRQAALSGNQSVIDPIISYGKNTVKTSKFFNQTAVLDVYTVAETNEQIATSIDAAIKTADALEYKGTVADSSALAALEARTDIKNGYVYKAASSFGYNNDSLTIKTGDLIIATGTEGSNGFIPVGNITWEIIPSGNEPFLKGKIVATTDHNPGFGLEDQNIAGDYASLNADAKKDKRPLFVSINNSESSSKLIKASGTGTVDNFSLTFEHLAPQSNAGTVSTFTTASPSVIRAITNQDTDSIGADQVAEFLALKQINRDSYGHIVSVVGNTIKLTHNYVNKLTTAHSSATNVYVLTSDTTVDSGKTYYTKSGNTYTKVNSPSGNPKTQNYYEYSADYVGTILLSAQDSLSMANTAFNTATNKGSFKIGSDTLKIESVNNTQLNVNLVWGSF